MWSGTLLIDKVAAFNIGAQDQPDPEFAVVAKPWQAERKAADRAAEEFDALQHVSFSLGEGVLPTLTSTEADFGDSFRPPPVPAPQAFLTAPSLTMYCGCQRLGRLRGKTM